jgi:hypothetical protein
VHDRRAELISLLQLAYSGELAAAYAYQGHSRSVRDPAERERIQRIEEDEWHHRRLVGEMLAGLGAAPDERRERRAAMIGRVLSALCHVSGWLIPMYGAGRLERRNIGEYEEAARLALASGRGDLVDCLLAMAEVEWDHEAYFRSCVLRHRLASRIPIWDAPPPRDSIRARFAEDGSRAAVV